MLPIDNNSKLNLKGELGKVNNDWYCLNCGAVWSQSCEERYIPAYCPNCKDPKESYRNW